MADERDHIAGMAKDLDWFASEVGPWLLVGTAIIIIAYIMFGE